MPAVAEANFAVAHSWIVQINARFNTLNNMSVTLFFSMAYNNFTVAKIGGVINLKSITKVRVARNSSNRVCIDVYYAQNDTNGMHVSMNCISGAYKDAFTVESLQAVTDTDLTTLIEYEVV